MKNIFKGKTALITGVSSGIGFSLAEKLLSFGAKVYGCSRTQESLDNAKGALKSYGEMAKLQLLDVRDTAAEKEYIRAVAAEGPIDYLFLNAGISFMRPFEEATEQNWNDLLGVNLLAVIAGIEAAVPIMLKQGGGHIISTSSLAGIIPSPFQSLYVTSKYAVTGLSESLRYEYADRNIKFSVVCPGKVATSIWQRDVNYKIHSKYPTPEDALPVDKAVDEILEGIVNGMGRIPVTDSPRLFAKKIGEDPAWVDEKMKESAAERRADFEYRKALKAQRGAEQK